MHFLLHHVDFVNQKPAELEVLTVQGSGCEGHVGWQCQQASTPCFGPNSLLPAPPGPAGVDGETTAMFPWAPLCIATFGVTFL